MSAAKKKVLITGGSGSLGSELVSRFCQLNYETVFTYAKSHQTAIEIANATGSNAVKVSEPADVEGLGDEFDVLINNAAINVSDNLTHETCSDTWQHTLDVNLTLPFLLVRKMLPHMIKSHWGRVISISSIYGFRASDGNLPYTVSKHGMRGLTATIAREYAAHGITANEVAPCAIDSELMRAIAARETDGSPDAVIEYLAAAANEIPARRLATVQDVASVVTFLASEHSSFVNGATIPVDGGWST